MDHLLSRRYQEQHFGVCSKVGTLLDFRFDENLIKVGTFSITHWMLRIRIL